MKKNLFTFLLTIITAFSYAQNDVTKFLGIPVDGFKSDMIKKLQAKGYIYDRENDVLKGEFNGADVNIRIVTNNNKVWRIYIADAVKVGETDIKIRFNKLCLQFEKNNKYERASLISYIISDEEDLSYEISINDKRYEALYYQKLNEADSIQYRAQVLEKLKEKYTDEQLNDTAQSNYIQIGLEAFEYLEEIKRKKSVWFMISEFYGKYYIAMFYDNEYNHSDGEDL